MTVYNVGSDHSGNGDKACINKVCELLNNAGHTANPLGVTPNLEGQLTSRQGIGVFIVNGLCIGTVRSCSKDLRGDGKIIFAIPRVLYGGNVSLPDGLKTQPLHLVNDGTNWGDGSEINGKTWDEVCGMYDNIEYVYGETCEDIAQAIIDGNFGGGSSTGTTDSKKEGSIMSGWESITDLLKPLDGEAMVVVRGDAVIIKRIYPPDTTKLWVYEGINVVDDSVTVSDYSPEIYNTFVVDWGAEYENQMEVSFTKHKDLFGERKTEVRASYPVPEEEAPQMTSSGALVGESAETEESDEDNDGGDIFGSLVGFLTGRGGGGGVSSASSEDMAQNLGTDNMSTTSDEEENPTADVPITDEAEAYLFGLKQVGKARRKSGHQIECKVIGSKYWEVGEWCRVYLPTFNEDSIMFISKVSHESSADSEWITSLTLVDYPPSLGTGQSNTPSGSDGTEQTEQGIINSLPNDGAEENTDTGENTQNG